MVIHEKGVVRYEAVCDQCGEYVGEYSDRRSAAQELTVHRLREHGPTRLTGEATDAE